MLLSCTVALSLMVATSGTPLSDQGVTLSDLSRGQQLEVRTDARVYRLTLVDPRTGESQAAVSDDGESFSRPAKVFFLGATQGLQSGGGEMLVRMGRIEPGLRVELGLGSLGRFDRALTERVQEVRLLPRGAE